ncbi:MAG: hypothetical protein LQ352_002736 [Teloschistes flavicans]|nr:MAG: hypothetical protein LQ352_002736 [Teloschistes flavicans]
MAESRVLHDKTKECMPESMQLNKPNALAVAILKPDRKPDGPKYEDDYLWVKCFAVSNYALLPYLADRAQRTTAEKLHEQCTLKAPPGEAFRLVHNASVLHPETTIGSISSSTSSLVVLEQIREAELETRLGRPRSALQQIE